VRIAPGSISFLVGGPYPLAKSGGPYLIQGIWFPSRLPLEGTGPYPDC
jgi:hypothetical protein